MTVVPIHESGLVLWAAATPSWVLVVSAIHGEDPPETQGSCGELRIWPGMDTGVEMEI